MQKVVVGRVAEYNIRHCVPADIPSVVTINTRTLPEHYSDYFYYEILSEFPETFLVAELGDGVVGYIMCRIEYGFSHLRRFGLARKGHIVSVAVLAEHRGKGVGTKLIEYAEEQMAKKSSRECIAGDTLILGDNKPISAIKEGDGAIGLERHNRVKQTVTREYKGDMIRIRANGLLPVEVTPEHPLLVATSRTDSRKRVSAFSELHWKRAQDLISKVSEHDGDYLVLPRLKGNTRRTREDLTRFTSPRGKKVAQTKGLPVSFPLDKNTAWLLGLYVAEGSSELDGIVFSLNKKEVELQKRIVEIGESIGYRPRIYAKSTVACAKISSLLLSRAFPEWCGRGAAGKKVPDFVLHHEDDELVAAFVKGWEQGDGCLIKDHGTEVFDGNTVSRLLALQLQLLYARLGRFVAVAEKGIDGASRIEGREVHVRKFYDVRYPTKPVKGKAKSRVLDSFVLSPIHRTERLPFDGRVYNLETEDNTYLVSNAVVHNCYLEVRVSNLQAIALYERLNYKRVSRLEGYYRDGEAAYLMASPLEKYG